MDNFSDYSACLQDAVHALDEQQIDGLVSILFDAYQKDKTVFFIGNGGSAANASHFAQDLAKGTRVSLHHPKRLRAMSLTDNVAFICAVGNDDGYDRIFEQQLRTYANPGDVLVAISGSGNSPNIVRAVKWANANHLLTVGLTGFDGGLLRQLNHHSVHVPLHDMGAAESIHTIILHYVVTALSDKMKREEHLTVAAL